MNIFKFKTKAEATVENTEDVQEMQSNQKAQSSKIRWHHKMPTLENLGQIFLFTPKMSIDIHEKGKIYICRICHDKVLFANTNLKSANIIEESFKNYYWIGPIPGESFF